MKKTIRKGAKSFHWDVLVIASALFLLGTRLYSIEITHNPGKGSAIHLRIVKEAKKYLGVPYAEAGIGNGGFDCSGLAYRVFLDVLGIDLSKTVADIARRGKKVTGEICPADILLFDTQGDGLPSHLGISIGSGQFIHAASSGSKKGVIVSSLDEKYYAPKYLGARRILPLAFPKVTIAFNDASMKKIDLSKEMIDGFPVNICFSNAMRSTLIVNYKVFKDEELVISKRMKLPYNEKPASMWLIPFPGHWKVRIEDSKNTVLAEIAFQ